MSGFVVELRRRGRSAATLGLAFFALVVPPALAGPGLAPKPPIVWKPIPFGAKRRSEMAAYAKRNYGLDTWRIQGPHVIVEHYTATTTLSSAYDTFAANAPDPELGDFPGDCAHFIVDTDGTIYQLVRVDTMCRHTVGLNYTALGIEHVGTSDAEILGNPAQLRASLELTLWLMERFHISLANVIGHSESLTSPYHRELYAPWRCQTHADWQRPDMNVYRTDLIALAQRDGLSLGRVPRPRRSSCA
ncbi:MAG TPA: peptidoglycan recognition family protein [Gaiellaceae bacterium]|nr:peptidoglycan recognition family protein [Gaiellaceae bacterium]